MGLKHFYTAAPLVEGAVRTLDKPLQQRLTRVLRLADGADIALFNGQDGLFRATLTDAARGHVTLGPCLRPQPIPAPLVLAIGLPKREAWDHVLRQATELGVTTIVPLHTRHAVADKINPDRILPRLIEAAEQCERLTLPTLTPLQPLSAWLDALHTPVAWAFERTPATRTPPAHPQPHTLLVGPEGGFSENEINQLQDHPACQPLSLGPTILRVDTAVVAGLALLRAG